jgi:hypothetical protein
LHERFREAVPVTLAEAHGLRERMARALDAFVDDALGEIAGLEAFGFTAGETREIAVDLYANRGVALPASGTRDAWRDLIEPNNASASAYDVANAITHAAQQQAPEDRLTWEERAGAYVMRRT